MLLHVLHTPQQLLIRDLLLSLPWCCQQWHTKSASIQNKMWLTVESRLQWSESNREFTMATVDACWSDDAVRVWNLEYILNTSRLVRNRNDYAELIAYSITINELCPVLMLSNESLLKRSLSHWHLSELRRLTYWSFSYVSPLLAR